MILLGLALGVGAVIIYYLWKQGKLAPVAKRLPSEVPSEPLAPTGEDVWSRVKTPVEPTKEEYETYVTEVAREAVTGTLTPSPELTLGYGEWFTIPTTVKEEPKVSIYGYPEFEGGY